MDSKGGKTLVILKVQLCMKTCLFIGPRYQKNVEYIPKQMSKNYVVFV